MKGYLVLAQGDYIKHAELLAKSIRATQTEIKNISVITDQVCDSSLFDHVIPIPDNDLAKDVSWKIHNRVYFYELSPYNETVILDADMIFLDDVSYWWNMFEKHQLLITDKVKTYRGTWVDYNPYRKAFKHNQLPNLFSAFCYFKKCDTVKEFFELVKTIISNWEHFSLLYTPNDRQNWPSLDLAFAIAVSILGLDVTSEFDYPTFTHMKSGCQGWEVYDERWRTHLGCYITNRLRLGNYNQQGILHYVDKELVNELSSLF
jgi:hypothetical protein